MIRMWRRTLLSPLLVFVLAPIVSISAARTLPHPLTPLVLDIAPATKGKPPQGKINLPAVDPKAPTPQYQSIRIAPLDAGDDVAMWLFQATTEDLEEMEGISFFLKGDDNPHHVDIVLKHVASKTVYRSRVFLRAPFWHRVFLPFSEFSAGLPVPGGRVARYSPTAATRIGVELHGPIASPTTFSIDVVSLTTWNEVNEALGWPTYMPPSHGFPPYVEDDSEDHLFSASGGAKISTVPIPDFPSSRFRKGVRLRLEDKQAAVSHPLTPREALPYFEGFAFWIKGDGADHLVEIRAGERGDLRYRFPFYVKGKRWKLLFAEFENFRHGEEHFEVEESTDPVIAISLADEAPATLTLGPIRLGYEK